MEKSKICVDPRTGNKGSRCQCGKFIYAGDEDPCDKCKETDMGRATERLNGLEKRLDQLNTKFDDIIVRLEDLEILLTK
jgi:hypothetical protein